MESYAIIELACKLSHTTPGQVTEKKNFSANVNVRALIVYMLTKYDRMHPILIGELINRPVNDVKGILKRISDIDRDYEILSPENAELFDMIDEVELILEQPFERIAV